MSEVADHISVEDIACVSIEVLQCSEVSPRDYFNNGIVIYELEATLAHELGKVQET